MATSDLTPTGTNVTNDATLTSKTAVRRVIFVDPTIPELQTLLDGVGPDAIAVVLDPGHDGVQQIVDFLEANELSDLSAVQIVSHGSEGSITLGSTVLDNGNVASYADALAQIGAALAADGDIMLYGCDVADGTTGEQFIAALANLTGADVAASTDPTGAAALGGDWMLESSTGPIETGSAFTTVAEENFDALLAAPTALSAEFKVNDTSDVTVGQFDNGAVIAELQNGFVVVWFNFHNPGLDGGLGGVFGQRFDNAGNPLGARFQVNGVTPTPFSLGTASNQIFPSATGLSDGGFVVVWSSDHDDSRGGDIYFQRYDANGVRVGTANALATDPAVNSPLALTNPTVNDLPGGGFLITWSQGTDGNYDIFGRFFNASGTAITGNLAINTTTANEQLQSSAAGLSAGRAIVVWQSKQDPGAAADAFGVYGRQVNADGTFGAEFRINTTTVNHQFSPSVVALGDVNGDLTIGNDGFVVVWTSEFQEAGATGEWGVFGQRYNNSFVKVGSEFQINQTSNGNQFAPSITALKGGDFVVQWTSFPSGADGSTDVFARRFTAGASTPAPDGNEVLINQTATGGQQTTGFQIHGIVPGGVPRANDHTLVQLSNGDLALAWSGQPDPFGTTSSDVFARVFSVGQNNNPANAIPVAGDDAFGVNEDSGANTLTVRANDTDADPGTNLIIDRIMSQPTNGGGTVSIAPDGLTVTFTPAANFAGQTTFSYRVFDGNNVNPGRDVATVTVNVTNDNNDPPVITAFARNPYFGPEFGGVHPQENLFRDVSVTIEGGDNIDGLTITVSNVINGADEKLIIDNTEIELNAHSEATTGGLGLDVTVTLNGTTATVTITHPGAGITTAQLDTLIETLAYTNANANPGTARRVVTLTSVSDTVGPTDTRTLSIASTASPPKVMQLVSVSSDGVQGDFNSDLGNGLDGDMAQTVSADGRYVVFSSRATTFVTAASLGGVDTNLTGSAGWDIFRHDRLTGETIRVSLSDGDQEVTHGQGALAPSISADGTKVLFSSGGNNLVAGDTNGTDLFLRDLTNNTTQRVNLSDSDQQLFASVTVGEISGDGTKVAFVYTGFGDSIDGGVIGGADNNGFNDVYLRDLTNSSTVLVSRTDTEGLANGHSARPSIDADGSRIAFESAATNLAAGDTSTNLDIFVRDLAAPNGGSTILVSGGVGGAQSNGNSFAAAISADGTKIIFESTASNLVAGDTNGVADVFLRDLTTNTTTRVSFNLDGSQRQFTSGAADISGDGRFVAYTNNSQIFVYDTQTGLTHQALTNFNGGLGGGFVPSLSHNGDYVIFQSNANNLVPYDSNTQFNISDVFAASLGTLHLGGTIWDDNGAGGGTAGNGLKDGTEAGIFSVLLSLFADTNGDNIPDALDSPLQTILTAADGSYRFTNLAAGDYIVRVDQTNFVFFDGDGFAQLVNRPLSPVTTPEPIDPDNDTDNDDNGARVGGQAAFSNAITLTANGEPTTEDGNNNTNFTLDFAFLANVAPVINNLNGNTVAFTEDSAAAVRLDQNLDATVTDANQTQLSGGNLIATVTSGNLQDQLSIATDDTILISGNTVQFDADGGGAGSPVTIGTVTGLNSSSLTVTFTTADATLAAVGALIQHLAYNNTNTGNPPASRSVVVTVNDGFSTSVNSTVTVNINQINDAPTVNPATLAAVTTDNTNPPGQSVTTLFAGALFTDPDNPAATITGILVSDNVADPLTEGAWQYSTNGGTNWFDIGAVSGTAGLALSAATLIRFVPTAGFEGPVDALSVFGLDNTYVGGFTNGATRVTQDAVTTNGGISPISDNPTTLGTTVNPPLNDEPTLTATAVNPIFTEDDASPADIFTQPIAASTVEGGQTFTSMTVRVTNLTDDADEILNFDGSAVALTNGNAITTATNGLNVTVSLVGMTATVTFSGASLNAAQLQTLIDGLSYQNNSQTPTDGDRVVTITQLVDSGSNIPPSDNTATPNIASTVNVDPVNDEPTLVATAVFNSIFTEDGLPADIFQPPIIASTVEPTQTLASMTLTVTNVTDGADEVIIINGVDVQLTDTFNVGLGGNAGTATVTVSGTDATVTITGATLDVPQLIALVDGLAYRNDSDTPTDANRVVTITQLVDSGSNIAPNDNTAVLDIPSTVNVEPLNDAPTLAAADNASYTENDPATLIDVAVDLNDVDSTNLTGATVTISDAIAGDELRINDELNGTLGQISFSFVGNQLTLTNTGTATVDDFEAALRLVQFRSTSENPTVFDNDTQRSINWQVTDGITPSLIDTTTLTITPINDAPDVDAPAQLGGPQGSTITISNVTFSDVDGGESPQTEIATFHAVEGSFAAAADANVTIDDTDPKNVILTGTLAALNAYITAGNLTYSTMTLETITVTLNDQGNTGNDPGLTGDNFSEEDSEDIEIVLNLVPVVTAGNTIHYVEQFPIPGPINPVVINGALLVDDPDGTTIDHASVTISAGFTTGDELRVNGQTSGTDVVGNIDFTFSGNTLTVTDIDTEANYQAFLRLVTFNNTTNTPDFFGFRPERTITWAVSEGIGDSAPATTTIIIDPINSQPVLFDVPTPLTYTEGTDQSIGFDAFVDTVDGPFPIAGGTITISNGFLPGDSIRWINSTSGTDFDGSIAFNYNAATGVFTFTTLDSGADYDSFFFRLRYSSRDPADPTRLGDDPTAGDTNLTRTLTWQVDDGGVSDSLSAPVDQIININAINDAPVVTIPEGALDLVTANVNSGDATVLLGDGAGNFAFTAPVHPVGTAPNSVTLGDLNGDLFLDIVTANSSNDVSVLLGDGLGGFTPQVPYPVAGLATGVALGDLNGDTILDIVTANDSGDVSVLLGDGLGGFGLQTAHQVGAAPNSVALGDLDGDGKLDIVTANGFDDNISVLLGDGTGGFASPTQHPAGTAPASVELGEISGDDRPDIVVANLGTSNYTVLLNFSFGIFSQGPQFVPDTINDIALGDLNGDGELDIVAGIGAGVNGAIDVRFGNGFSNFTPIQPPTPVPDTPSTVGLGDVNGDGRLDIVATHLASSTFSVLLNQGGGMFTVVPPQSIAPGNGPISLALGNLDNAQVTDEDTPLFLNAANGNAITLSDADAGSNNVTMILSVGHGSVTVAAAIGLEVNNNASDTVELIGTVAEINAALAAGIAYLGDLNFNGADTLTVTANDNGSTGAPGALTNTQLLPIIVNAVNDAPTINFPNPISVIEDVASPLTGIILGDVEAEASNATVLATLSIAAGSLAAPNNPGGTGVTVGGTSSAMTLTGTIAAINAFIATSNVTFTTALNATADVTLTVKVNDGGASGQDPGLSGDANSEEGTNTVTLGVIAVNDNPAAAGVTSDVTVTEDVASNLDLSAITLSDVDSDPDNITLTMAANAGTMTAASGGGVTVGGSGTNVLTLTGAVGSIDAFLNVASNIKYTTALNAAGDNVAALTLNANDGGHNGVGGGGIVGFGTINIDSTAVNDAPVNAVPGALSVDKNANLVITGLALTDPDAVSGTLTATLSVTHGTLTAASAGGAGVFGSGTASVILTGTLAQINTTLSAPNNLIYHGSFGAFPDDTLTMISNDGGNTGSGGALSDIDTSTIHLITILGGTSDNDSFTALPGNERIDGNGGIDTVTFGFRLIDATVSYSGNQVIIDGPAGSHTVLTGFERFVFTDGTVDNNDGNWLVDDLFYYSQYHDVWNAHADADAHYNANGWHEWRDPSAFFSTSLYLGAYQDVKALGINPLDHWHSTGWIDGRVPSFTFDARQYQLDYLDVAAVHVDPLEHFLHHGGQEGRQPVAPTGLIAANGFDYIYYLQHNPDVLAAHVDPFEHFQSHGWHEGRNPNALFDTNGYLSTYPDVAAAGVNPLDHYHLYGWNEGRDPSVSFDTGSYLAAYPDVAAAHIDPLWHFLQNGIHEGRSPFPDGTWG